MDQETKNAIVEYVSRAALQLRHDEIIRLQTEAQRVPALVEKQAELDDCLKTQTAEAKRLKSYFSDWQIQCIEKDKLIEAGSQRMAELTDKNSLLIKLCWCIGVVGLAFGFLAPRIFTHS